jgi:hypothetical protein
MPHHVQQQHPSMSSPHIALSNNLKPQEINRSPFIENQRAMHPSIALRRNSHSVENAHSQFVENRHDTYRKLHGQRCSPHLRHESEQLNEELMRQRSSNERIMDRVASHSNMSSMIRQRYEEYPSQFSREYEHECHLPQQPHRNLPGSNYGLAAQDVQLKRNLPNTMQRTSDSSRQGGRDDPPMSPRINLTQQQPERIGVLSHAKNMRPLPRHDEENLSQGPKVSLETNPSETMKNSNGVLPISQSTSEKKPSSPSVEKEQKVRNSIMKILDFFLEMIISCLSSSPPLKNQKDSKEKELFSGALMALVSLASGTASSSSQPSRKNSICTSESSVRETQTPPPSTHAPVSTITPVSSAATMLVPHKAPKEDLSSTVSYDSNAKSEQADVSAHCRSYGPNETPSTQCLSMNRSFSSQENCPPPSRELTRENLPQFPLATGRGIPVPRLDRNVPTRSYTLSMRRDYEARGEREELYEFRRPRYLPSDESYHHEVRNRPRRFYSAPVEYSRHGYHEYERGIETPPLPHMTEGFRRQIRERVHPDYPRKYELDTRRSFDEVSQRNSFMKEHLVRQNNGRIRAASRDDCEERSQQFQMMRHQLPEEAYYSPSHHYLPLHEKQHQGPPFPPSSQTIQRRNHLIQHQPPAHRVKAQEVRVQFECPDRLGSRKDIPTNNRGNVPVQGDYSLSPYHLLPYNNRMSRPEAHHQELMGVKKTILRRKCAWKNYPELEKFLIENREEYLMHSAKNYTIEQKQYNNRLTEKLLEVAAKHNYIFDPNDFNFVAVRDRIRCYYKSYVQSNKKRGVIVGYDALGTKKKQKINSGEGKETESAENAVPQKTNENTKSNSGEGKEMESAGNAVPQKNNENMKSNSVGGSEDPKLPIV